MSTSTAGVPTKVSEKIPIPTKEFWGELHPPELNLEQIPSNESVQTFQGPEGHQTVTSLKKNKGCRRSAYGTLRWELWDGFPLKRSKR